MQALAARKASARDGDARPPPASRLRLSAPGDKYEREADRVADRVLRMPAPPLEVAALGGGESPPPIQTKCAACAAGGAPCPACTQGEARVMPAPASASAPPQIQRAVPEKDDDLVQRATFDEEEQFVQPKEASSGGQAPQPVPAQLAAGVGALRGGGEPLSDSVRAYFEPRFGRAFSGVRLHTGPRADAAANAIGARAFTLGPTIAFARGEYAPATNSGRRLLAHELVHTLQQSPNGGGVVRRKPKTDALQDAHMEHASKPAACACLVHIHNEERNAKRMAELLQQQCQYNLVTVKRGGKKHATSRRVLQKSIGGRGVDPNELFSKDHVKACEGIISADPAAAEQAIESMPEKKKKDIKAKVGCQFYFMIRNCSDTFKLPVIALHNNKDDYTGSVKKKIDAIEKETSGSGEKVRVKDKKVKALAAATKSLVNKSTNIYSWCASPAIAKCSIGDKTKPDHLVWTVLEEDYNRVRKEGKYNVVLQDRTFLPDDDLSTMFNFLDELFAPGTGASPRYVNIETPHKTRGKYEPKRAAADFDFVKEILLSLGLYCCPGDFARWICEVLNNTYVMGLNCEVIESETEKIKKDLEEHKEK